ncbi:hypothetical protein DLAC_05415 [Tieghemostelium lacteum]|uniref:EGF-like domain-containing protein n=1 Tax=Tieghemostelium lacteum TaxID=361077 RepID=A0A151ZG35_TIELA|nr:hypothetical protein DLAC_05415 [Tieghemostelium lacteum]|eukprot:KYQ92830.1 hypothetical protein DLAC_05415 [Tieghemostelium lacteum]
MSPTTKIVNESDGGFDASYLFKTGAGYAVIPLNITKRLYYNLVITTGSGYYCNSQTVNNTLCLICKTLDALQLAPSLTVNGIENLNTRFSVIFSSFVPVEFISAPTYQIYPSVPELPSKTNYYVTFSASNYHGYSFISATGLSPLNYVVGGSPGNLKLISTFSLVESKVVSPQLIYFNGYYPTTPGVISLPNFTVSTTYVAPSTLYTNFTTSESSIDYLSIDVNGQVENPFSSPMNFGQNLFVSEYPNYYPFAYRYAKPITLPQVTMNYILLVPNSYGTEIFLNGNSIYNNNISITDNNPPALFDIQYTRINSRSMIVTATAIDDVSGIKRIYLHPASNPTYRYYELNSWDLANGNIRNGTFQKLITYRFEMAGGDLRVSVEDHYGRKATYQYLNSNYLPNYLYDYTNLKYQEKSDITSISFKNGYLMDVSTSPKNNTMIIKFKSPKPDISVCLFFSNDINQINRYFVGDWNEELQQTEIDFYLPSRLLSGPVYYIITYPAHVIYSPLLNQLYPTSNLTVYSQNCDRLPPLITSIIEFSNSSYFGFDITIEDETGFDRGFISVKSNLDGYRFNFTLSSVGKNATLDVYRLALPMTSNCVTQTFSFDFVELYDVNEAYSTYSRGNSELISPFMKILDSINSTVLLCDTPGDNNFPALSSISTSVATVDTGSENRLVSLLFSVTEGEEIYQNHLPYCLANAENLMYHTAVSTFINTSGSESFFQCDFNLPFGFGFPSDSKKILFAIHGFSDTSLNIMGSGGFYAEFMNVTFSNNPTITNASKMTSQGGLLTLFGRNFGQDKTKTIVEVQYKDLKFNYSTSSLYHVMAVIDNILEKQADFNVTVINNGIRSNTYTIPTGYIPPISPIPTNPTIKCPGAPQCGGPSNGVCVGSVCQCISPWIGSDCLSQVINVPIPNINTTDPDIDNNFNSTLPDGKTVTLKTLISILSIIEMDINNNPIQEHPFTKWIFTNVTQTTVQEYQYATNISNNGVITNVTVTLQYFSEETTLIFANQLLNILPSSIKYNIDITPYKFSSDLNYLQLIMSASIESSSTDTCTYQETGTSKDTNSDYVKLQIDSNSLYARFIKRGIVDNRVRSIQNIFYNNESSSTNSISRIGINIPNYSKSVKLDPDFSVLIDFTEATDKENSLCPQNSKNSLTKSQLAGIIIGSIAFGIIAIVSITYYIYKKKQQQKLVAKIGKKLNNFNQ